MFEMINNKKRHIWDCFLMICFSFYPVALFSQVINGSFEINGQPSLENWVTSCIWLGESYQDAPPDGGDWCLKLKSRSLLGCTIGGASQIIPDIQNGEIWQVSVWSKYYYSFTHASIYFSIIHPTDYPTVLSTDTTTSNNWIQLTVVDTIFLEPGDSVAINLDAGRTGGPIDGWSYFDLVRAEKIGELNIKPHEDGSMQPNQFYLFQNYPNPFNPVTNIHYELNKNAHVAIIIYDLLGRKVKKLVSGEMGAGEYEVVWDGTNDLGNHVSAGVYLYQLRTQLRSASYDGQAENFVQTRKMLLLK